MSTGGLRSSGVHEDLLPAALDGEVWLLQHPVPRRAQLDGLRGDQCPRSTPL